MVSGVSIRYAFLAHEIQVLGLQYYHIAKIVLGVSIHETPTLGYETFRQGRKIEVPLQVAGLIFVADPRAAETRSESFVDHYRPCELKQKSRKHAVHRKTYVARL